MNNKGFVKLIILIVIVLIVLGYFGFNLQSIIESPTVQNNLIYVWKFIKMIWTDFLAVPFVFIWNKLIIGVVWRLIEAGLSHL